jgi:ABC-type multidrug transport system ATPase subunit
MNNLVLTDLMIGRNPDSPLNLRINDCLGAGEIYYISGQNGSGKTTLMRTICGYLPPLFGNISVKNLLSVTAYYGHDTALKQKMTTGEYLNFCFKIFENTQDLDGLIRVFKLESVLDMPISYLSCGQKKRVSLVAFLLCERKIYCFDEASSGLDSHFKTVFYDYISNLAVTKQKIILFSDHINPQLPHQKHINLQDFYCYAD